MWAILIFTMCTEATIFFIEWHDDNRWKTLLVTIVSHFHQYFLLSCKGAILQHPTARHHGRRRFWLWFCNDSAKFLLLSKNMVFWQWVCGFKIAIWRDRGMNLFIILVDVHESLWKAWNLFYNTLFLPHFIQIMLRIVEVCFRKVLRKLGVSCRTCSDPATTTWFLRNHYKNLPQNLFWSPKR